MLKVGMCFAIYLGITARALLEQETLHSCLVQMQASGCQKGSEAETTTCKSAGSRCRYHTLEGEHQPIIGMPRVP